jgi:tetratricopeptide (TPR) repeat protein
MTLTPALRTAVSPSLRLACCVALLLAALGAAAQTLSLPQARRGLDAAGAQVRLAAVERLGEIGSMADADRLVPRLADAEEEVRASATTSLWRIWSRSGDPAIDALFARGLAEMQGGRLDDALATFSGIVRRKPAFAEGWNKRATVLFLLGRHTESLKDCDEVVKRNPNHFGALSGAAQNHLALGDPERALAWYRRALKVNPGLTDAEETLRALEERIAAKRRSTT